MTATETGHRSIDHHEDNDGVYSSKARKRGRRRALGCLLGLVLLVNLSMSLYQLPLNRVVERRLCREYYAARDPTVPGPGGEISEELCKVDAVQKELAWIQGAMETEWIVGGWSRSSPYDII